VFYSEDEAMKKKLTVEPIVAPELLELAKKSLEAEKRPATTRCGVCGALCTPLTGPQTPDELCWVCRRLKISAWRDSDQQVPAQE